MKVKNLYVGIVNSGNIQSAVIVKECSKLKMVAQFLLDKRIDPSYHCVFTGTRYYFHPREVEPLATFLPIEKKTRKMSESQLLSVYQEQSSVMVKKMIAPKIIGFQNNEVLQ